jgi:beta-lactamase class D
LPRVSIVSDNAVIHRRHALGLLAAAGLLPQRSFANVAQQRSEIHEDLAQHFIDEGTAGTFVGYKIDEYLIIASDKDRSGEAKLPASTFKIPNSLIALETGVVEDPDKDVFKWDGVTRSIEAWNRDHTMRSAIAVSAVPVYQEIARRIGQERMQKYVDLLEYGNRNIGGGIDQFWLTGDLRIDPMQQIDFVDRLRRGALPISKRSQDLVRDILPVTKVGDVTIRAKSGLLGAEIGKPSLGWMVGWAEKGSAQTVRAQHGLPGAAPHRRSHDLDASLPARHRRDLMFVMPGLDGLWSKRSAARQFGADAPHFPIRPRWVNPNPAEYFRP